MPAGGALLQLGLVSEGQRQDEFCLVSEFNAETRLAGDGVTDNPLEHVRDH